MRKLKTIKRFQHVITQQEFNEINWHRGTPLAPEASAEEAKPKEESKSIEKPKPVVKAEPLVASEPAPEQPKRKRQRIRINRSEKIQIK